MPGVAHEQLHELPLLGREVHRLAAGGDALGRQVDGEVRPSRRSGASSTGVAATLQGAEPGEQLVHPEGLGDVVVGTLVEGVDLGGLLVTGRQHDHRHLRPRPQAAEHVEAVHAREAEVEDDDVGVVAGGGGQPLLARCSATSTS